MNDVIYRNISRLIQPAADTEPERIEPMTEWKWRQLDQIAVDYGIGPWIAEGLKARQGDFFLQMPPTLFQEFLLLQGPKDNERLERFLLEVERSRGLLHRLSRQSLQAYASDLIHTIKNIEE